MLHYPHINTPTWGFEENIGNIAITDPFPWLLLLAGVKVEPDLFNKLNSFSTLSSHQMEIKQIETWKKHGIYFFREKQKKTSKKTPHNNRPQTSHPSILRFSHPIVPSSICKAKSPKSIEDQSLMCFCQADLPWQA